MQHHDHSYKKLFSEPRMVEDLVRGFVQGKWVQELDFATLTRVSGTYVSDDLREREDDMVWKIKFAGSSWLYLYLLLEFQSKPDFFMALRVYVYTGLLYQDLIAQKVVQIGDNLPPILPLVLYNGRGKWNAPTDMWELIQPIPGLEVYRPRCSYLLLEENQYPAEMLANLKNLVAALFRLEQSRTPADVRNVLDLLVEWLKEPSQEGLRRAFLVWMKQVLLPARLGSVEIPEMNNLSEVRAMLEERVVEWTQEWKAEGRKEGEAEATQRERERLILRIEKRFGALTSEQQHQLKSMDAEALLDGLLEASSIEDILTPKA